MNSIQDIKPISYVKANTTEVLSTVKGNKLNSGIVSVGRETIETEIKITKATSPLAKEFEGFNTELAPSYEPAILVMKPLSEKTFAKNAINCRNSAISKA